MNGTYFIQIIRVGEKIIQTGKKNRFFRLVRVYYIFHSAVYVLHVITQIRILSAYTLSKTHPVDDYLKKKCMHIHFELLNKKLENVTFFIQYRFNMICIYARQGQRLPSLVYKLKLKQITMEIQQNGVSECNDLIGDVQ